MLLYANNNQQKQISYENFSKNKPKELKHFPSQKTEVFVIQVLIGVFDFCTITILDYL